MINKIAINNFKSFERVELELKNTTLLFGPNASGKSTLIKSLIFLSENLQNLDNETKFEFENFNLISYKDIVFNGNVDLDITFELYLKGEFYFPSINFFDIESFGENIYNLYKLVNLKNNERPIDNSLIDLEVFTFREEFVCKFENGDISFLDNFAKLLVFLQERVDGDLTQKTDLIRKEVCNVKIDIRFKNDSNNYSFKNIEIFDINNNITYFIEPVPKDKNYGLDSEPNRPNYLKSSFILGNNHEEYQSLRNTDNAELIQIPEIRKINEVENIDYTYLREIEETNSVFDNFTTIYKYALINFISKKIIPETIKYELKCKHLPTTRETPKPKYLLHNRKFNSNDYYGILRYIETKAIHINKYLKDLNLCDELTLFKNEDIGYLKVKHKIVENNLANESSGLVQILPILFFLVHPYVNSKIDNYKLVEGVINNKKYCINNYIPQLVLIEQPELHLHPKLQCGLAEIFIKSKDDVKIIETHSEHIIKKIQVEIAKGKFDRNLVGVYYFDKKNGKTYIKEMEIEDNGFFKEPWPNGFFDDSANLSWELLGASRKN